MLTVKALPNGIALVNSSDFDLSAVKVGEHAIRNIGAKGTVLLEGPKLAPRGGRFPLSQWSSALRMPSEALSPHHLITAGVEPDALEPGLAGDPESSVNIQKLRAHRGTLFECADGYGGVCGGLIAYATRYLETEQLSILLNAVPPTHSHLPYPSGYEVLPTAVVSIRHAFERHGHEALGTIRIPTVWLKDRGIDHPELLKSLALAPPKGEMGPYRIAKDFNGALSAVETAYRNGYEHAAAQWSLEAWRLKPARELTPAELRFVCSGFDAGAALAMKAAQYLAGFGYLRLLSTFCPDTPGQRERFADWFAQQATEAFGDLRLEDARVMFERAHFFDRSPKTRAQWADTLAELAILRFREGHYHIGRTYLSQASELAAYRPKVLAAQDADPGGNKRAKIGIMIVICFLGFFSIRRLRRVWFGDLTRVRRKRR